MKMSNCDGGIPRWLEVGVAMIALVISSPLLLIAFAAVALTSRGPVIFQQERVGLGGRLFKLYKFRTMRAANSGPEVTAGDDNRITPVGKVLRKTKIDEFPELWNVVRGEMAFVGPRPEVPRYVDLSNPLWQEILKVRPGITDPVTLQLRNEEVLLARIHGDRERFYLKELQPFKLKGYKEYSTRRSFVSDIGVLWRTCVAIILPGCAPPPTLGDISGSQEKIV